MQALLQAARNTLAAGDDAQALKPLTGFSLIFQRTTGCLPSARLATHTT
jgi:hypothetical protein